MTKSPQPDASRPTSPARGEGEGRSLSPDSLPPSRGKVAGAQRMTDEGVAVKFARRLRKNMTDAERKLWSALRDRRFDNYKFRRQVPVGHYIVDFVDFEHRLIVEIDGGQHSGSVKDVTRDAWFISQGFRTMRFWNVDVFQALDGTMLAILDALKQGPSSGAARHLRPQGEKEGNES